MNLLADIITYIRRIIKTQNNAQITDDLLIDYINRFLLMDVDARIELFDLKTTYQFMTVPGVDQYNMPLYSIQNSATDYAIGPFPIYQGFLGPCFVNGVEVPFQTQKGIFDNVWPSYFNKTTLSTQGDGGSTYDLSLPILSNVANPTNQPFSSAILRGHVDLTGIMAFQNNGGTTDPPLVADGTYIPLIPTTSVISKVYFSSTDSSGNNVVVCDSGQFLDSNINYGLLMQQGNAPNGNLALNGGYSTTSNTINYLTGVATGVTFPSAIPSGTPIFANAIYYQLGMPRAVLYYDNVITLRAPPDSQYVVSMTAYLSPAAFLNTADAIPFGYMAEYIARGAARKILSDVGDIEQFNFYEPLFQEQELLVWKRSARQFASTRTQTIYSSRGLGFGNWNQFSGVN